MTPNRLVACMLSNKSPRHAITSCSGFNSFLWIRWPFHLSLGIKQLSRLINLTDRPHCAQCQPVRKPYCLLSWRLTFLLFFDSSYLKEALSASPVIDLKKTASSRRIIECLNQKLWSLVGAYNLSAEIQWNEVHPRHEEAVTVFVYSVVYILNISLLQVTFSLFLACCFLLHPMMKLKWNFSKCVSVKACVCVYASACLRARVHVIVCLCESEEGERGKIQTEV